MRFTACFNPHPAFARGVTRALIAEQVKQGKFQSAPRVRTRGDKTTSATCREVEAFQSAPRVRTRGDEMPASI